MEIGWSEPKQILVLESTVWDGNLAQTLSSRAQTQLRNEIRAATTRVYSALRSLSRGPGVYRLAVCKPEGKVPRWVYLGFGQNVQDRIWSYCEGSHLKSLLQWHLAWGWNILVSTQRFTTARKAKAFELHALRENKPDWNTHACLSGIKIDDPHITLLPARFHPAWDDSPRARELQLRLFKRWYLADRRGKLKKLPVIGISSARR